MLGIKEDGMPSDEQRAMMIQGIGKYYGQYTPEELFLACEMNHYGKYDQRIDHYGKFTIDYLSSCLHLFNEEKKKAIRKEKMETPPLPKDDFYKERSDKYLSDTNQLYWTDLVQFVKEQGYIPLFWDWERAYRHRKNTGELTHYTAQRMDEIYNKVKAGLRAVSSKEKMGATSIGQLISAENSSSDTSIKYECRKVVIHEILKSKYSNYICKENPLL